MLQTVRVIDVLLYIKQSESSRKINFIQNKGNLSYQYGNFNYESLTVSAVKMCKCTVRHALTIFV